MRKLVVENNDREEDTSVLENKLTLHETPPIKPSLNSQSLLLKQKQVEILESRSITSEDGKDEVEKDINIAQQKSKPLPLSESSSGEQSDDKGNQIQGRVIPPTESDIANDNDSNKSKSRNSLRREHTSILASEEGVEEIPIESVEASEPEKKQEDDPQRSLLELEELNTRLKANKSTFIQPNIKFKNMTPKVGDFKEKAEEDGSEIKAQPKVATCQKEIKDLNNGWNLPEPVAEIKPPKTSQPKKSDTWDLGDKTEWRSKDKNGWDIPKEKQNSGWRFDERPATSTTRPKPANLGKSAVPTLPKKAKEALKDDDDLDFDIDEIDF